MADFTVRSDHIDVEQIMRQIRARIRDKRGADYTEQEIRELASVKLDKFLDPRAVRSDLLQHYRRERQPAPLITPEEAHPPLYDFTPETVYVSDRGAAGRLLTIIRKILKPFSKLFFHVDTLWDVLTKQSTLNRQHTALFQRVHQRLVTRDELDALNFEMFNNLVVELTRLGIEVKNLRMQVESFGTRLDFDERRARALEGVVQYRPGAPVARPPQPAPPVRTEAGRPEPGAAGPADEGDDDESADGSGGETRSARRRRRRRGRRRGPGEGGPDEPRGPSASGQASSPAASGAEPSAPEAPQGDEEARPTHEQAFWASIESRSTDVTWTTERSQTEETEETTPELADRIEHGSIERESIEAGTAEGAFDTGAVEEDPLVAAAEEALAADAETAAADAGEGEAEAPANATAESGSEADADVDAASDRPTFTRIFDSPRPSKPGDPESSAS